MELVDVSMDEASAPPSTMTSGGDSPVSSPPQSAEGAMKNFSRASMTDRESAVLIKSLSTRQLRSAESLHSEESSIPFYSPPIQRQRWGEEQVLPHVNWGDLFFDLFYVAAAYNLGSMLLSALTPYLWYRGVAYFVGMFGSLMHIWTSKLVYDARYSVVDYFHRIIDLIRVGFLSFAVMHIKSFDLMSDPSSVETFAFTLGIFLESVVRVVLDLELVLFGQGDKVALRKSARQLLLFSTIPVALIYLVAVIISGKAFFHIHTGDTEKTYERPSEYHGNAGGSNEKDEIHGKDDDHNRFLARTDSAYHTSSTYNEGFGMSDLPIALCLISYLLTNVYFFVRTAFILPSDGEHKRVMIPMNIDFTIHRYGEWIMLMLGESVLSLLIVEVVEAKDYYIVAMVGIITVIMMQTLHFESQPGRADGHAMRRDKVAGTSYSLIIQLYSMSLIAFGVSYKAMLSGISAEVALASSDYNHGARSLFALLITGGISFESIFHDGSRFLASTARVSDSIVAALFSGSLAIALLTLEVMTFLHKGLATNYERCFVSSGSQQHKGFHWPCVALTSTKAALFLFAATLPLWVTEPQWIALVGFAVVMLFVLTRILGWRLISNEAVCRKLHAKTLEKIEEVEMRKPP